MDEKSEIKTQYDRRAEEIGQDLEKVRDMFKDVPPVMSYFRNRKVETVLKLGKFTKGSRILDVGSNMGQYTTILAERGFRMVGIDLSDKAIDVAKKNARMSNFKNLDYFQADAEDLNLFKDGEFDGVVSFSTLRYVPNLKKALKEIYRVVKKGGRACLDFPNRYCPWFMLLKNRFGVENHIYDHFFSAKDLASLYKEAGFLDIDAKKIMFTHYTFKPKFLTCYKTVDFIGERIPLIKEMAAIIVCKGVKA